MHVYPCGVFQIKVIWVFLCIPADLVITNIYNIWREKVKYKSDYSIPWINVVFLDNTQVEERQANNVLEFDIPGLVFVYQWTFSKR